MLVIDATFKWYSAEEKFIESRTPVPRSMYIIRIVHLTEGPKEITRSVGPPVLQSILVPLTTTAD